MTVTVMTQMMTSVTHSCLSLLKVPKHKGQHKNLSHHWCMIILTWSLGSQRKMGQAGQYLIGRDTLPQTIEEPLSESKEECSHLSLLPIDMTGTPSSSSSAPKQSTSTRFVWALKHYTEIDYVQNGNSETHITHNVSTFYYSSSSSSEVPK